MRVRSILAALCIATSMVGLVGCQKADTPTPASQAPGVQPTAQTNPVALAREKDMAQQAAFMAQHHTQ